MECIAAFDCLRSTPAGLRLASLLPFSQYWSLPPNLLNLQLNLHPLQPGAMRCDGALGLKKHIPSSNLGT
jgi:hypothetical protein